EGVVGNGPAAAGGAADADGAHDDLVLGLRLFLLLVGGHDLAGIPDRQARRHESADGGLQEAASRQVSSLHVSLPACRKRYEPGLTKDARPQKEKQTPPPKFPPPRSPEVVIPPPPPPVSPAPDRTPAKPVALRPPSLALRAGDGGRCVEGSSPASGKE